MKSKQLAFILSTILMANSALAGGLYMYEIGTEDVGLANAGMAARAQDAATVATNPAGMTRLTGDQTTLGVQALYGNVEYKQDGNGALKGNDPGNVVGWFPSASNFYSHSVNDRLKLGIAMYGNFGLGLHFGNWAGSTLIKDSTLTAMTFQPTAAYKIDDHWSIGAGLGINYGYLSLKRQTSTGEEQSKDHDWAANAKIGLLYELNNATRFGITYTSQTKYNFNINTTATVSYTIPNPIPLRPDITITKAFNIPASGLVNTPAQVMFSGFHQITPEWAILGNIGWQAWSQYGNSEVWAADKQSPSKGRLRDTYHAAIGAQYQMNEALRLNSGIAFDTSFYKSQSDTSLTMPSGNAWRFGVGAQYQLSNKSSIGGAFEYIRMQGSQVQSTLLSGNYETSKIYFFSLNYSYRF